MDSGHKWDFIEQPHGGFHMWRVVCANGDTEVSEPFASLVAAKENATLRGFEPENDPWTVTAQGRSTYFRPGQAALNLPEGAEPD